MKKPAFRSRGAGLAGWILIPGILACYFLPLTMTFGYATMNTAFDRQFVGLENFRYLLSNRYFILGAGNLLSIGAESFTLGMATMLGLGFPLYSHPRLMRRGIGILLLPMLIPSVSAINIWKVVFHTNTLMPGANARLALITLFLWQHTGIGAILLALVLRNLPGEMLDAAALEGAGRLRIFFHIQLPNILGVLAMDSILLIMFFLRIFKESYLLFGQYPSEDVYLLQHYMNHQYLKMNFQHVAASAVLLALFACVGYLALYRLIRREGILV
jgi:multiple sugar transport system permease protein